MNLGDCDHLSIAGGCGNKTRFDIDVDIDISRSRVDSTSTFSGHSSEVWVWEGERACVDIRSCVYV